MMRGLFIILIWLNIAMLVTAQQNNFDVIKESRVGCIPDGIIFESQAQVDSFPLNYPGCNTILGYVNLEWDVYNVDSLIQLNRIEGGLSVSTPNMTSLSGLDSLEYLRMLLFEFGSGPMTLNGLNNVDTIRYMEFSNTEFVDFTGLDDLVYTQSVRIEGCQLLRSLSGLENLAVVDDYLIIDSNPSLQDMSGLNNLQQINGFLHISGNDSLTSLAALNNADLSSLEYLSICNNEMLAACNEPFLCEFLSNPPGEVNIYNNAPGCNNPSEIADSCGFTLTCLPYGNYYVVSQAEADSFAANYPGCLELNGRLTIEWDDITDLSGLIGIERINGDLSVINTQNLVDFTGMDSLQSIEGSFYVGFYESNANHSLINFTGLGNLERIEQQFQVLQNTHLQNFNGLENLKYAGEINIAYNWNLSSLQGLNSLDTVAGDFSINSELLTSLSGLENLNYADEFTVLGNTLLTSLHGIDSAKLGRIQILNNPLLSECEVKSVCNLLAIPGSYALIENNATGCNSREEVEEKCLVGIYSIDPDGKLNLYPNPAGDYFTLQHNDKGKQVQLEIFNSYGQVVLTRRILSENEWIDISFLPNGLYFAKADKLTCKFIKR